FTLPTLDDNLVEGSESYSVALSTPTTNATAGAVAIDSAATSVTTTILDNDTQTFSLTETSTSVTEGSADTYAVHLSNPIDPGATVSVHLGIPLPGGLGGAETADFISAFTTDLATPGAAHSGVSFNATTGTLTFTSAFDTNTPLSFTLPTLDDNLVEGSESYSVALSTPTTNATAGAVAIDSAATSVTTTILDNDTQTFSLTETSTSVTEGSADTYAVHLSNPIDPGVTVSVHLGITLPGGLGGAETADFISAFTTDVATAVAARSGVSFNANTGRLSFTSAFDTNTPLSFTLPTLDDNLVEGSESYSVALSTPTTNATAAAAAIDSAATSGTTTILDNDTQTFSLTETSTSVTEGSADTYAVHQSNPIDPGVTVSVHLGITLPGGLGGAETADFISAITTDVATAVAARSGVSF